MECIPLYDAIFFLIAAQAATEGRRLAGNFTADCCGQQANEDIPSAQKKSCYIFDFNYFSTAIARILGKKKRCMAAFSFSLAEKDIGRKLA